MYFHRPDPDTSAPENTLVWLFFLALFGFFSLVVLDTTLQANGLYGSRTVTVETVSNKRLVTRGRRGVQPTIWFAHRGQQFRAEIMRDEFDQIAIGQRLKVIIVQPRFQIPLSSPSVFLDKPGFKHNPHSRMVTFGLVIIVHFGLLYLLFKFCLDRARRREEDRRRLPSPRVGGLTLR